MEVKSQGSISFLGDFIVICVAGLALMGSGGLTGPILPLYANRFTDSLLLIGAMVSGYWFFRAPSEVLFGSLSDTLGSRRIMAAGMLMSLIGSILCALAGGVYQIMAGRVVWGVGGAGFFCTSIAYISRIAPESSKGRFLGILQSVEYIGSSLGRV